MYYVREKTWASNHLVRESDVRHKRHIGNRWEYNGKRLGTNYTGGKRNSTVSFMFFKFPTDWGMGNLWMLFKKFGTVFDMYMVQKRLRNGERYGFVRFKLVTNVEGLLKRLREIKFGEENLKVFVAYDRKNLGVRGDEVNRSVGNEMRKGNGWKDNGWNGGTRDERNFAEVVNGEKRDRDKKESGWEGRNDGCRNEGERIENKDKKEDVRIVEVCDDEVNTTLFNKCLIGEVKSMCYLTKLGSICGEQGLSNVEVKLLGGLEVLMVFDTPETATNILNSSGHGLRRWVHKMRIWNKNYTLPGRITWINIIGVPVSCWSESVFKKIAALHGRVIGSSNCKLEGNQNLIVGKVQLHTINKGLIKESLYLKLYEKKFKVDIIEEVGDVMEFEMEEKGDIGKNENELKDPQENGDENDMVISDSESSVKSSDDDDGTDSEAEDEVEIGIRLEDGDRKIEDDEDSRFSGRSRVCETPEVETTKKEEKSAADVDNTPRRKKSDAPNISDDMTNKKRKANGDDEDDLVSNTNGNTSNIKDTEFDETNKNNVFNEGVDNGARNSSKKGGKKCTKKAARGHRMGGLGTNEKGVSDVHNNYQKEGDEDKETFVFRSTGQADSISKGCSVDMEQVKEIDEIIEVSWAKAENENARDVETVLKEGEKKDDHLGFGETEKKGWIKSIIREERPDMIGVQETKCGEIDDMVCGRKGEWKGKDGDMNLACIYGPHVGRQKACLWERIRGLMDSSKGAWCIFGDLNMVRGIEERRNSQVNIRETTDFNDFINDAKLIEIPMGGESSLGKLSDHCLIVLKDVDLDFGPKPFRAFDIWLEERDIRNVVEEAWKIEVRGRRPDCRFRDKLKNVKSVLKEWSKERFRAVNEKIELVKKDAMKWELEAENRTLSEVEKEAWMKARKSWVDKENELKGTGYQERDKNKDKTGQNRARDRKEHEKTSPTVPSDFIGPALRLPIKELMEGIKDEGNDMQFVSYQVKQDSKKPVGSLKFSYQFRKKSKKQAPVNPQLDQDPCIPKTVVPCFGLVIPYPEESEDETLAASRERLKFENDDFICRGHILNAMSDPLFDVYQNYSTAKELWNALEERYFTEDATSKKFIVSKFNSYKMVDSRPIMDQMYELEHILSMFTQNNMNMDESIQVASIIDKLPSTWKDVKKNLKHRKDDLSLKDLGNHLLIEEQYRLENKTNDDTSKVHVVEEKGESSKAGGKKRRHGDKDKKKFKKNKKDVIYYNCKKPGHFKRECRALKKKQDRGNDNKNKDNNFVAMIYEAFSLEEEKSWWVDSGATRHVCNDQTMFKTYEPSYSMLYMGNHSTAQVKGKGKIDLVFTSGNTLTLNDVLHVPDVRKNLVSGSLLNKFGFKLVFEFDKFILSKGGKFVGKGYHTDGMFKLNIKDVVNSSVNDVNTTEISDANDASAGIVTNNDAINKMPTSSYYFESSLLWHARLGHIYFKCMRNMANANLIPKLDSKNDKRQTCMHTKITRLPFPTIQRSSKISELVHTDVYEVLEKFRIYKSEVELKCDTRIKYFRTDMGGEYYDPRYFQSTGIVHQVTAPYTPQQNGIAERKNRTLMDMVNSMMLYSGLSSGYWGEALLTTYEDPQTYSKAMKSHDSSFWKEAANDEMDSIIGNNTWILVDLPPGSKAIKSIVLFRFFTTLSE
ncbi:zinc finger, CCHC-type containing protein [Tanacetum coccineum]